MVTTLQIKPNEFLQPFVTCYALREFNAGTEGLLKPMFAVHESYMTFFLKSSYCKICDVEGVPNGTVSHALVSLFTQSHGGTLYHGDHNGVSAIFGIPQSTLINSILSLDLILGSEAFLLGDQLAEATDIAAMGNIMDEYLTHRLLRQHTNVYNPAICAASNIILKNYGMINISSLASYVNMSCRNFERRFIAQVGMPPKLYARITKFFTAIEDKAQHPDKTWTQIAYQYNYFDQAHFIKDVREFSYRSPEDLFKSTPPVPETYVNKVEY
jgi:AraC-like DNA-binding protein